MDRQALARIKGASLSKFRAEEKAVEAMDLRRAGHSYQVIADTLGYASASAARNAVVKRLERRLTENTEAVRALELDRLDVLLRTFWPQAEAGNRESAAMCLRIMERRAKLCGLDLQRQEITHKGRANNQTLVVINGGKEDYIEGLRAYERRLTQAAEQLSGPIIEAETVDETTEVAESS